MFRVGLFLLLLALLSCGGTAKKSTVAPEPVALSGDAYAHYLRGQLAHFQGDYRLAETELAEAKRFAPDQAPIVRALAEAHYNAGDRKAAEAEMRWALQQWPRDARVWLQSGMLQLSARDFSAAARSFKTAIALGARSEEACLSHAHALVESGQSKAAKSVYRKLIGREEGSAESHYQLAVLLHGEGRYEAAGKHAEKTTIQTPYDLRAWALLADALRAQGLIDESGDALRRPFDRSRGNANIGKQLFVELLDLGARDHALASVAILDRDDLPADTRIGMGHWLLRAGDFEGALAIADRLAGPKPLTIAISELRARALRALHRDDEAIAQLGATLAREENNALMRAMLARALADTGNIERARTVVAHGLEARPDNPDLIMANAAVEEAAGDAERAREILSAAVARHPSAQRPLFALAELETRSGDNHRAIATITPMLRATPRSYAALNYIGYTLISDISMRTRSKDMLLRALELAPDSAFVLDSYGWFLMQTGKHSEAAPLIERAVRLTPAEPELLAHLAELRWIEGRRGEAKELLKRARNLALTKHAQGVVDQVRSRLTQETQ
ncbi:MAG: tetratricopeptide repeat protein [Myxococcales bacterium]|nr:tetratricopeptide repeat protein [Myxococcales bacterium]